MKETTPLSHTKLLPQKFTLKRQLEKQNIRNCRNKQKESTKEHLIERMEDSPVKELNEMGESKLSDIEF